MLFAPGYTQATARGGETTPHALQCGVLGHRPGKHCHHSPLKADNQDTQGQAPLLVTALSLSQLAHLVQETSTQPSLACCHIPSAARLVAHPYSTGLAAMYQRPRVPGFLHRCYHLWGTSGQPRAGGRGKGTVLRLDV